MDLPAGAWEGPDSRSFWKGRHQLPRAWGCQGSLLESQSAPTAHCPGSGSPFPGLQEEDLAGRGEQLTTDSVSGWPEQMAPHREAVPENLTLQAGPP